MSRMHKRTKKTVLIVGEGFTEFAFLQHIKELFITRSSGISVKVEHANGGAPEKIVEKALRLRTSKSYDSCFVLLDVDVPFEPTASLTRKMKRKPEIQVLSATPCIEGLFLSVLDQINFLQSSTNTRDCKRLFDNYVPSEKKTEKYSYRPIFTITVLQERRNSLPELDAILKAMDV